MRAVLLSLVLLLASAIGASPAAAQEPPARQPGLERVAVSRRRAERDGDHGTDRRLDCRRDQPRARAQPRRCCWPKTAWDGPAGARWSALSALLPNVSGHVAESRQVINLAAYGFPLPGRHPADRRTVQRVRRARLGVAVDPRLARAQRPPRRSSTTSRRRSTPTRARAISSCWSPANAYLQALAASARADVGARAGRDGAGALQPGDRSAAERHRRRHRRAARGSRSSARERQRVTVAQNEFEKAKLQLARIIGLPVGQAFTLVSELPTVPIPDLTLEEALERAYKIAPGLPGRARAREGGRSGARGRRRRIAAVGARQRRLRRRSA